MTTFSKGETVDTTKLQSEEPIHAYFPFYNINSIQYFTSILNVVCENTRIICLFPTASKRAPVIIICFVLTILNN